MNITKEEALKKIEELKKYIDEKDSEKKIVGVAIKTIFGSILFQSTKSAVKEAVLERLSIGANLIDANLRYANLSDADLSDADLRDADLSNADLSGANLRYANLSGANLSDANLRCADLSSANLRCADLSNAEMQNVKFYGKGGTKPLTKAQVPAFLLALGYKIED